MTNCTLLQVTKMVFIESNGSGLFQEG